MKVILSLTTIPSRIEYALKIAKENIMQGCHEIWINIPRKYNRFPEWKSYTINSENPKIIINRECEDLGPATKLFGPINKLKNDDIIVYIDDDTHYDIRLVSTLLKHYISDKTSAWGLSGFCLKSYFKNEYHREHGMNVDVIEGYGGVLLKVEWGLKIMNDFLKLREEAKFADDVIISNLLHKIEVNLKTVFTPKLHIGMIEQYRYGFNEDALHNQTEGGHKENYKRVLDSLKSKNMYYFKENVD